MTFEGSTLPQNMLSYSQNSEADLNKIISKADLQNNVSKPNKTSVINVSEDTDIAA